jgi:hypothetical protein
VGIAPVPPDRLPGQLPPGLNFPLVITVQTEGGENFDRPVPVRFPNLPDPVTGEVLPPGAKTALWSFNHDSGQWEIQGPMTVTADGRYAESDLGVGIRQPGWHAVQPGAVGSCDLIFTYLPFLPPGGTGNTGNNNNNNNNNGNPACFGRYVLPQKVFSTFGDASPDGRFQVRVNRDFSETQVIVQRRNGAVVIQERFPSSDSGTYNFSPNGDLFVLQHGRIFFDLIAYKIDGSGQPVRILSERSPDQATWAFSPHGRYLAYEHLTVGIGDRQAELHVINASSGNELFRSGPLRVASSALANAHTGFSPDSSDGVFVFATSTFSPFPEYGIKKLRGGLSITRRLNSERPRWEFSPCGEKAALTVSSGARDEITLYDLTGGSTVHRTAFDPVLYYEATATTHEAVTGSGRIPLTGNNAPNGNQVRSTGLHHYLLVDQTTGDVVQRGIAGHAGIAHVNLIVRPDTPYRNYILRADSLLVGHSDFVSTGNGTRFQLPPIVLVEDSSLDTDEDGIPDLGEFIMNTGDSNPDSDGDGLADGSEVRQGTDPLGPQSAAGLVASVPTAGPAFNVCAINDLAIVACGTNGLTVFNLGGASPVRIGQTVTGGEARAVSCSGSLVAVADGPAGLTIVDITDPPAARVTRQLNLRGYGQAVAAAGDFAFAGTREGDLTLLDLASGVVLEQLNLGGAIEDLVVEGDYLYAYANGRLQILPITVGLLEVIGSTASPAPSGLSPVSGRGRMFVGGGIAYLVHARGYNTFSITNPSAPMLLLQGNAVPAQFGWAQVVLNGSGRMLGVLGPTAAAEGSHDLSVRLTGDPSAFSTLETTILTPGVARAVSIYNGLAYLADGEAGLQVVNYLAFDNRGSNPAVSLTGSFVLTGPTNGIAEEGKILRLTASVTDDVQVRNVEFYLDGERVITDGNFPFEHRFLTPSLASGRTNFSVRARATDTGGNFAWSDEITLSLVPDFTPPRVVRVLPSNQSIATNAAALVFFNEPMDPASFDLATFRLLSAGPDFVFGTADDVAVPGVISYRDTLNAAVFAYPPALPYGAYRGTVTTNVTDAAGNRLRAEFTWNFAVAATGADPDTDADGWPDGNELLYGTDPLDPASRPRVPGMLVSAGVSVANLPQNPPAPTNGVLASLPVALVNLRTNPPPPSNAVLGSLPVSILNGLQNPPPPTNALLPSLSVTYENR